MRREWQEKLEEIDRTAAARREKSERWKKPGRFLKPLRVGDKVVIQNFKTKRWDRYGIVQEYHKDFRRYVIRCESGMMLKRNRIHLRLRFSDTATHRPEFTEELEKQETVPIFGDHVETPPLVEESSAALEASHMEQGEIVPELAVPDGPAMTSPRSERPSPDPVPARRSTRTRKAPRRFNDYVMN